MTVRTRAQLLADFADNTVGGITEQKLRNLVDSLTLTAEGWGARVAPSVVQSANLRSDGTVALAFAPTAGNLLVFVYSGYTGGESGFAPPGFTKISSFDSDGNNRVGLWTRTAQAGDTGSYALSATDNQGCALLEVANCAGVQTLGGGAMSGQFSGANFSLVPQTGLFQGAQLRVVAFESDGTPNWTITAQTGLTIVYNPPLSAVNHQGAVVVLTDAVTGAVAGSTSSAPTQPVFGVWALVGKSP